MTKNTNNIIYEVEGSLALITINRPERKNALDSETLEMLNGQILSQDTKHFC